MTPVPHSRPWITEADIAAVSDALRSQFIGQGERTAHFEARLSDWVGAAGGVAVGSGSAALVLALASLGVEADDEVVLPSYLCPEVLEAVLTIGATPVLCDGGPHWVVTPPNVRAVITAKTRAIIVPHLHGIFADVDAFRAFGLPIVEDCAQAIDGHGQRRIAGDVAVASFHPTKCLTTAEGGMILARQPEIIAVARAIRDGTRDSPHARLFAPMSDLSAALGTSQLDRYDEALARRRGLAARYSRALTAAGVTGVPVFAAGETMYFRFPLRRAGGVDACAAAFLDQGVVVRRGINALLHHLRGLPDQQFPVSCDLFSTTVLLPIHPSLTDNEQERCVAAAVSILSTATE